MSISYRLGILAAILLSFLTGYGQSKSYKIYESLANETGVTYFAFSKSMIDAINLNLDDENKKITGDLNEIRILIYNSKEGKIPKFEEKIARRLTDMNYSTVELKNQDKDDDVDFWIEGKDKNVKECHVIVREKNDGHHSIMVSFYGNFTVDDLDGLGKFSARQGK